MAKLIYSLGGAVLGDFKLDKERITSGRQLVLNKPLTTLGKPGVGVAVITRPPHSYFIAHVDGHPFL